MGRRNLACLHLIAIGGAELSHVRVTGWMGATNRALHL
jgi:hypothetical protein